MLSDAKVRHPIFPALSIAETSCQSQSIKLAGAIGRECGNEPRGPFKGNHKGLFIRIISSFPVEHREEKESITTHGHQQVASNSAKPGAMFVQTKRRTHPLMQPLHLQTCDTRLPINWHGGVSNSYGLRSSARLTNNKNRRQMVIHPKPLPEQGLAQ